MQLTARTEAEGYGPPTLVVRSKLGAAHLPPRPSRRDQVAVGEPLAGLISRGRWKGEEGGGEKGCRPMGGAKCNHVTPSGRGPRVLTGLQAGASAAAQSSGGGAGVRARLLH